MEFLKGFSFDIQRFAGIDVSATGYYYLEVDANYTSISLQDTGWSSTGTTATTKTTVVRVNVGAVDTISSIEVATTTAGTEYGEITGWADYTKAVTTGALDNAAGAISFLTTDKYVLTASGIGQNVVAGTSLKDGSLITLANNETLTVGGKAWKATGATSFKQIGTTFALVAGTTTIPDGSEYSLGIAASTAATTVANTLTFNKAASATVTNAGVVADLPADGLVGGVPATKTVTTTANTVDGAKFTVNNVEYSLTTAGTAATVFTAAEAGASTIAFGTGVTKVTFTNPTASAAVTVGSNVFTLTKANTQYVIGTSGAVTEGTFTLDNTTATTLVAGQTFTLGTLSGATTAEVVVSSDTVQEITLQKNASLNTGATATKDLIVKTATLAAGDAVAFGIATSVQTYVAATAGSLTFKNDGTADLLQSGSVTLDAVGTKVYASAGDLVTRVSGTFTVDQSGKVSGLTDGDKFTIADENAGNVVTYTITKNGDQLQAIISGGKNDGVWNITSDSYIVAVAGTEDQLSGFVNANDITKHITSGGTAELTKIDSGKSLVFHKGNDGAEIDTEYARLTNKAGVYTFTVDKNAADLGTFTADASKMGSADTINVTGNANDAGKITYKTIGGATFTTEAATFNFTKDTISDVDFTLTSGTAELAAGYKSAVTTTVGKLTITDTDTSGSIKVTSDGAVTGVNATDTVTLGQNTEASDTDTATFSVNGTSFTAYTAVAGGTQITNNAGTLTLTAGKIAVSNGDTAYYNGAGTPRKVKVTAGDGVTLTATGLLAGLNNGDVVELEVAAGGTTYVYTVVEGNLQITDKATGATIGGTALYKLTGETLSMNTQVLPTTGEYEDATKVDFQSKIGNYTAATTQRVVDKAYLDKNAHVQLTDKDAVGQFSVSNNGETVTYTASSAQNHIVTIAAGANNNAVSWSLNTLGGKDEIEFTATSDATINTGAGKDTIRVGAAGTAVNGSIFVNAGDDANKIDFYANGDSTVYAGNGNDTLTVGGNGAHLVTVGGGNNKIDASATTGDISIGGGSGKDTIIATDKAVVYGGDGNDVFDVSGSGAIIKDYSYGSDALEVATTEITGFNASKYGADGVISLSAGKVDLSASTGDFYAASLVGGTNKLNVAFAKENGSNIDVQSLTSNVVLVGNNNEETGDALYAGSGKDTIYAGANDSVFGGAGDDRIHLNSSATGIVVGISSTSGKDTVSGFNAKFEEGDSIFMVDGTVSDLKTTYNASSKDLVVKDGKGVLTLSSVDKSTVTGAVELKVGDSKFAVLAEGAAATVESADYANAYIGSKSVVNFSKVEGDLNVNLANGLSSADEGIKFEGFTSVVGGAGNSTLMGTSGADSIVAYAGNTSLYGGAGKDTLVGANDSADVFFFGAGTGNNTVVNFSAAGGTNAADKMKVLGSISGAKLVSAGVELSVSDGSKAVLNSLDANSMVSIEADNFTGVAKIGSSTSTNTFTYAKEVGYYGGGTATDKLAVSSSDTDNAEVWLDGSKGVAYASIDQVDFSAGSANYILAGDSSQQTITGGKGENSLWGGVGNTADVLKGTSGGTNTFFYGFGEGNDTITSVNADDTVNLYNIKLSDVKSGEITSAGVSVEFTDGNKLTVSTSRNIKFSLASGETYIANHNTKQWDNA